MFQFSLVAQSCLTLCDSMNHSTPGLPVDHQLPESTQTHVHQVNDAIQPSHPLSSPSHPALNLSQHQGLFQWVSSLASGGQSIGPSTSTSVLPIRPSGLISFMMDWLDLLAVQGTLKSLLHYSSKASILWHSAFSIVQLSHPYMTTGKTIALTRWTFVDKVMFLLFIFFYLFIFSFIFISWRLITLQYCSGFFHTLTLISHWFTCIPHPDPPSHWFPPLSKCA